MHPETNLKEIERNAYLFYHNDGLIDVILGFVAVVFGIVFYFDPGMYFFFIGFIIAATPMYIWLKNRVTVPRIGLVSFKPERQARVQRLMQIIVAITILAVIVTNAIWILSAMKLLPGGLSTFLEQYYMIYFGAILAAILWIGAYLTELRRFYAYGLVVLAAFVGLHFLEVPGQLGAAMAIAGTVIMLWGMALLLRFLRKYPSTDSAQATGQ